MDLRLGMRRAGLDPWLEQSQCEWVVLVQLALPLAAGALEAPARELIALLDQSEGLIAALAAWNLA